MFNRTARSRTSSGAGSIGVQVQLAIDARVRRYQSGGLRNPSRGPRSASGRLFCRPRPIVEPERCFSLRRVGDRTLALTVSVQEEPYVPGAKPIVGSESLAPLTQLISTIFTCSVRALPLCETGSRIETPRKTSNCAPSRSCHSRSVLGTEGMR